MPLEKSFFHFKIKVNLCKNKQTNTILNLRLALYFAQNLMYLDLECTYFFISSPEIYANDLHLINIQ